MGEEASATASSSVAGGGEGAEGVGKGKAAPASKEDATNAAPSGSEAGEAGKQPQANGETPSEAEGDKPAETDGESIPRATSAPPLLEEFQVRRARLSPCPGQPCAPLCTQTDHLAGPLEEASCQSMGFTIGVSSLGALPDLGVFPPLSFHTYSTVPAWLCAYDLS